MEENKVALSDKDLRERADMLWLTFNGTSQKFVDAIFRELVAVRDQTRSGHTIKALKELFPDD